MDGDVFPTASVIVVGYNSRRFLDVCLGSLSNQAYPGDYEILFVDNASTDGSAEYVRTQFPTVRVIESGENLGYAGGNNLGAKFALGDVLAFINPDTQAEPDWLRELVRPLVEDPTVGLTTSKIVLMDNPEIINTFGTNLSLSGLTTCRRANELAATIVNDEEVSATSGAACAMRADLFHQLGGFDELFWMYLEDTDLAWRVRLAGYRCVAAASSIIRHEYTLSISPMKTRGLECNRYLMLAKNLGGWALIGLMPYLLLAELLTWSWALLQGPRYLQAKALAILWAVAHIADLWRAHQATQELRRRTDRSIIQQHIVEPPITEVASGRAGQLAAWVLIPIAIALGTLALGVASAVQSEWPDEIQLAGNEGIVEIEVGAD